MGNIAAIVGRPNVGKSTLFNRLTETRTAIVNEENNKTANGIFTFIYLNNKHNYKASKQFSDMSINH